MITGISIENFKGIREPVEIELRPLTLLFGANSAGKSSILHALQYAAEVLLHRNLDADRTQTGGAAVDLGGFRNFVYGHETRRLVTLRFDMDLGGEGLEPYVDEYPGIMQYLRLAEVELARAVRAAAITLEIGYSELRLEASVRRYEVELNGELFATIVHTPDQRSTVIADLNTGHPVLWTPRDGVAVPGNPEEIEVLELILGDVDRPILDTCLEYVRELLPYSATGSIPLHGTQDALPEWDELLPIAWVRSDSDLPDAYFSKVEVRQDLVRGLTRLIVGPGLRLRQWLKELVYLGPIRAVPPRDHTPPRTPDPGRWASGLGAWDRLAAADDAFVSQVSHWLGDEECLNAGYHLRMMRFKELDLSDPLLVQLLTGRAFDDAEVGARLELHRVPTQSRLLVVPSEGTIELRPNDVGVGIWQVIPVIVSALDGTERLVTIEQPELHIHPRLQAALADLFLEACQKQQHRFLIETHSEHCILRLQRRIRETSKGKPVEGRSLMSEDVVVYHVSHDGERTQVRRIEVDGQGEFIQPWPDNFFEIDFYERFA